MFLPENVLDCIHTLERRGFACYAVGGCVRDALLGIVPHDYDLCTNARPGQIREAFSDHPLVLAGEKHGTVGVVTGQGVIEITTFRTEGGYTDSRHPDWVAFVDDIEGDLARRDFTVNAMAYSPTRGFADPFGGRADLQNRVLRAVGHGPDRFEEDALRILRGVRFSVRFQLTPEPATEKAMLQLAPLLDKIARERVFEELCKLLPLVTAEDLLRFHPVITRVIPELAPAVGFVQHSSHHAYDIFTHTAYVTAAVPAELSLRWAALLHDVGKAETFTLDEQGQGHFYGHAEVGAALADTVLLRLKAPTALRKEVVFLIGHHMTPIVPDRKLLKRRLSQYGQRLLTLLLALQKADYTCKGVAGETVDFTDTEILLSQIMEENACLTVRDLAIDGHDLMALGFSGPAIGSCMNALLAMVVDEMIPNEKAALIAAARRRLH